MTRFSRHSLVSIFLSLAMVMGVSAGAGATSIPINNDSFESPVTTTWITGTITDWVALPSYDGVQKHNFLYGGTYYAISGGDGDQEAYIQSPGQISQVLTATIQPGTTYTLGALVGSYYSQNLASYHVQLYDATNLNVPLAEASGQLNTTGSFVPVSTQYVANPANYGHALEIVLVNTDASTEIEYDKITLTSSAVPLPPTVWLLGSGLVGLVGLRRRWSLKK